MPFSRDLPGPENEPMFPTLQADYCLIYSGTNHKHVADVPVVSDSLRSHRLQHARLPCSLLSPRVCSNSCPLSWWCQPTISSSVVPFSSFPQSSPTSGSFPMTWLFESGGQSIGASASVLPVNIQGWFPLKLTDLVSYIYICIYSFQIILHSKLLQHIYYSFLCHIVGPCWLSSIYSSVYLLIPSS